MELGILSGVAAIGYLLNQRNRENEFDENNQLQLDDYLRKQKYQQQLAQNHDFGYQQSFADSYPLYSQEYSPEYVKHQQRVLSGLPKTNNHKPMQNNRENEQMPKEFKKHLEKNYEDFTNFIPSNDPTSDLLLDMKDRPMTDFLHNNMVPFYRGDGTKQNMAGTGVADGSYIDGSNVPGNITGVNSGFDYSTPWQTQLATFTGNDDTYLHKREVGPMFSPAEQQTGWVNGTPLFRPDMDRYTEGLSQMRNDLRPVEPEMIGPGLNIDPSIPASGGFHDFTRILPTNVDDYKANQLPGQVITGKYFSTGLPTSYPGIGVSGEKTAPGVSKHKPNSFWDQSRYPTMTTKAAFQGNLDYNIPQYEADFKPNNAARDQISFGLGNMEYKNNQNKFNALGGNQNNDQTLCVNEEVTIGTGPLGSRIPVTGQRSETYMSQDNNIRSKSDCNSQPIGNPERAAFGHGNIMANWYVNETDRGTVNPQNVMQLNLMAEKQGSAFWTATDTARTTTKETTDFAYQGNAERSTDGYTFYTYTDEPKSTTKETTAYAYASNPSRPKDGATFYSYVDEPGTTTKETTSYSYTGTAGIPGFADTSRFQFMGNS
jgi:hypothetical protein